MSFAGYEWFLVVAVSLISIVLLVGMNYIGIQNRVKAIDYVTFNCLLIAYIVLLFVVALIPAVSRHKTLSAKRDLQNSGFYVASLSVSNEKAKVGVSANTDGCLLPVTMDKIDGKYRVYVEMSNGEFTELTSSHLQQMCDILS